MTALYKQVFVISDIHLGGDWPAVEAPPGSRGFRMLTRAHELAAFITQRAEQRVPRVELVINGDIVDFLAELPLSSEGQPHPEVWRAFEPDGNVMARLLRQRIAKRPGDAEVLGALHKLLKNGHELTLILGNHDVELCLPAVRQALYELLGCRPNEPRLRFFYDGEPYFVGGSVLIEHGNHYDRFNRIDHGALCQLRIAQARRLTTRRRIEVRVPPGSQLVVKVMNRLKRRYPFIDLLKPETEAVVPLLLTLAPELRWEIAAAVRALSGLLQPAREAPTGPQQAALADDGLVDPLFQLLEKSLGSPASARQFLTQLDQLVPPLPAADEAPVDASFSDPFVAAARKAAIAAKRVGYAAGRFTASAIGSLTGAGPSSAAALLALSFTWDSAERRTMLLQALRCLRGEQSFSVEVETDVDILQGVKNLASAAAQAANADNAQGVVRLKYIIFGHTHLAKRVTLPAEGVTYFNSGTWVDLMEVPRQLVEGSEEEAEAELNRFIAALESRDPAPFITYRPTYVRIDLDGPEEIREIGLYLHRPGQKDQKL